MKPSSRIRTKLGLIAGLSAIVAGLLVIPAAAAEPIKLGTLLSLTGDLAAYGPPIQRGADLAAKHINAQGGLLKGQPLVLVHRDDGTTEQTGIDAAQKLVSLDKVPAFVGALGSGVTLAVANSVSIPNQIVQISPSSTSPLLTSLRDNDFLFRTVPSDAFQGLVLGQLAAELGYKRISILYVNNPYGVGLAEKTKAAFEAKGGTVLASVPFQQGQDSYRGELQQAIAKGRPDALVLVAYVESGTTIVRQAVEGGFARKFLFSDGLKAPEIIRAIGKDILEGTYGTTAAPPEVNAFDFFRSEYEKNYGSLQDKPYTDTAYDALFVLALGIEKAGKATGPAIRDGIRAVLDPKGETVRAGEWAKAKRLIAEGKKIRYVGASGVITFDAAGDLASTTIGIWKITNGDIVQERTVTP